MDKSVIIGKEGEQKFPIKNAGVSRHHARISIVGGKWLLEDLNSTNGTFVNDEILPYKQKKQLKINDIVRFADVKYRFV